MKHVFYFFSLTLFLSHPLAAQSDSAPAAGNIGNAEYPRISVDQRVTFRLKAPEAKKVQVRGGSGLVKEALDLVKSDDGVWTGTTPPAAGGFHYYWFVVDGVIVNDTARPSSFGWGRECSGIDVPEKDPKDEDFYAAKEVPHGDVRVNWYQSKITGKLRRAHVYTPPGYDEQLQQRFPVLYLQHGAGENERGWVEQGRANFILDNLFAAGKAVPMIAVVDTGYASRQGSEGAGPTSAFEEVMLTELIPLIDTRYRTIADADHRAMAGLSMGSGQTLNIAPRHPDRFAWIGAMSGPPRKGFDVKTSFDGVFADAAAFNKRTRLLWLSAGTAEEEIHRNTLAMHEALTQSEIKCVFYSSPGTDHEWQTWRRSLFEFAQRLFKN
jgi:enterochelin esterase-like enzyme